MASRLFDYVFNRFRDTAVKSGPDKLHIDAVGLTRSGPSNKELYAPDNNLYKPEEIARLYQQSPYVYSAVRMIAKSLSSVDLHVYKKGNPRKRKETGPIYTLLNFVNPTMSPTQLMEFTASWLALAGRVFWAIEDTPAPYANISPVSIYPLNPQYVKIVPDPDTKVMGIVYEVSGKKIYYPMERVVEFSEFSSIDYWVGNSPLNALAYDIQIERFIKKEYRNRFYNASVLDGVLKVGNEWDDDEIRKLKREFKEQHEGTKNAHRILILTEGMEYEQLREPTGNQTTPLVLNDVLDTHGMVFGVPSGLLNPKSTDANTLKELKGLMWENTIVPMARLIQEAITKQLCMRVSVLLEVEFDFSNVYALRLHDLDRARVEVAHLNAGIKTANEIRLERGLDPLKFESSDMPFPEWSALAKANTASRGTPDGGSSASPSLTMPGSQGGRDQSSSGEAQMLDQTAQRNLEEDDFNLNVFKQ